MKALKVLTILTIAGLTGVSAHNLPDQENYNQEPQMRSGEPHFRGGMRRAKIKKRGDIRRRVARIMRKLDLTEEQKAELKSARKEMTAKIKKQRRETKGAWRLNKFITKDGFNRDGYIRAATKRADMMATVRADMLKKSFKILTPEQKKQFVGELNRKRRGRK